MKKYNVLVYGSGGREHALAYKVSQSVLLNKLFLALPNDGFKNLGEEIQFFDFTELAQKCVANSIDLVVIGPEDPLSKGLVDILKENGIKCIGVPRRWAQLESSKKHAKEFMIKHNIPTAKYFVVSKEHDIDSILSKFSTPPVLKADGLAAGKGVHLSLDMEDAKSTLIEFLAGKWGNASKSVVVEERLDGEELSIISIFDGETLLSFVPARDYKRLYDGQSGPNTGGMGAFCPVELTEVQNIDLKNYLKKLEGGLRSENADFAGIIYSGLMLTTDGIKVLEYNMRFGDPETQPLMMHLDSDILDIFVKASEKRLSEVDLKWKSGTTIAVVVASRGYPQNPKKGCEITELEDAYSKNGTTVFFAGVKVKESKMYSNGGRVFCVVTSGEDIETVRKKIYKTIDEIDFKDKVFREDIGL